MAAATAATALPIMDYCSEETLNTPAGPGGWFLGTVKRPVDNRVHGLSPVVVNDQRQLAVAGPLVEVIEVQGDADRPILV